MSLCKTVASILAAGFLSLAIGASNLYTNEHPKQQAVELTYKRGYYNKVRSSERPKDTSIDKLVIHYTAGDTVCGSVEALQKKGASYHYIIDRNGTIYQLADNERVTHHVKGTLEDKLKFTKDTIGISLANYGWVYKGKDKKFHNRYGVLYAGKIQELKDIKTIKKYDWKRYWEPYTDKQQQALNDLCRKLTLDYKIKIDRDHIYGHEDISTNNTDPGPVFNWEEFYQNLKK